MNDKTKPVSDPKEAARDVVEKAGRQYFRPEHLAAAQERIGTLMEAANALDMPVRFEFDTGSPIPEGHGLAIIPVTKRDPEAKKNVKVGIAFALLPDPDSILLKEPRAADFVRSTLTDALVNRVANAVRPKTDGSTAATVPTTLDDFITSASDGMAGFNSIASAWISRLRKKKFRTLTKETFRQVLSSAAAAEQQFPTVPQYKWEGLLDRMIAQLEADPDNEPGILRVWRANRNQVEVEDVDFDLDELDELMDEEAGEDTNSTEASA